MATGISVFSYASAGYILTSTGKFVVYDMYTGDQIDAVNYSRGSADPSDIQMPYRVGVFSNFAVPTLTHTMAIADGITNTFMRLNSWTINSTIPPFASTYGTDPIVQLFNTKPILTVFNPTSSYFVVVYENDTNLGVYSWTKASASPTQKFLYNISGFGEIVAASGDFYGRIFVIDKGCNYCLKIMTTQGNITSVQNLPELVNPRHIQITRNRVYILDNLGIISYTLALRATYTSPLNLTCASGAIVNTTVTGGSPPYMVRILPDQLSASSVANPNFFYNYTTTIQERFQYNTTFYLYDDAIAPEFQEAVTTGQSAISTPASVFTPYSGKSSWRMLMASKYQYGLMPSTVLLGGSIMANYFSTLEMWVNVGDGIGVWSIDMGTSTQFLYATYKPGDFQLNTWTKISIDLSMGPLPAYYKLNFIDYSNSNSTTSFLYVDDIRLIPYNSSARSFAIVDFCNATLISPKFATDTSSELAVAVTTQSTSCNPTDSTNKNKSTDGSINAITTGGFPPYIYTWSFSNSSKNNITGLSAIKMNINIYDNALNSSFKDNSYGDYSLADPTVYHSAPYSISIIPSGINSSLIFFFAGGISATKYSSIDFWLYASGIGGQLLFAGMVSAQSNIINSILIHRLLNIPSIPSNVWIKVTYPIPPAIGLFYGFVINTQAGIVQPKIYVDDIVAISTDLNVVVTDSAKCKVINNYISVLSPRSISITPTISNILCYGSGNGSITLNTTGGTAPYIYNWTDFPSTNTRSVDGLLDSIYLVSVTDANSCVPRSVSIEVLQPPPLNITVSQRTTTVCSGNKVSVNATVAGGVGPYTFIWSYMNSNSSYSQVLPVPTPSPFAVFIDSWQTSFSLDIQTNASIACYGNNDHQNNLFASYSGYCAILGQPVTTNVLFTLLSTNNIDFAVYSSLQFWIKLQNESDAENLNIVLYSSGLPVLSKLLLDGSTGYSGWQKVTLLFPTYGSANSFTLVKRGGITSYFIIDDIVLIPTTFFSNGGRVNPGFVSTIDGTAGSYTLTVTDSNSCPTSVSIQITAPEVLLATLDTIAPSSNNNDGQVTAVVTGGVPPYSYYWPNISQTTATVVGLAAGFYVVQITDANRCTINVPVLLPAYQGHIIAHNKSVATGFGVVIGLCAALAAAVAVILVFRWADFVYYSPFYCSIIILGVFISFVATATVLPYPTDNLCIAFPWLLGIAFNLVYGCLFIKTWVLYSIFHKASKLQRTNLTPFYILKVLSVFLGIEIVFLIIWTVVDPPKAGYADLLDNRQEWQCVNHTSVFWIIFLSFKGAWLIFGAGMAFLSRNIAKEYNESKSIAYAIYNDIVLLIVAVPLAIVLKDQRSGIVIVEAAAVLLTFTFTLIILFTPIIYQIFFSGTEISLPVTRTGNLSASASTRSGSNSRSSNTNSKSSSDPSNSQS